MAHVVAGRDFQPAAFRPASRAVPRNWGSRHAGARPGLFRGAGRAFVRPAAAGETPPGGKPEGMERREAQPSVWHLAAPRPLRTGARLSALHRGDFGPRTVLPRLGQRTLRPPDPGAFAPFVLPRPALAGAPT